MCIYIKLSLFNIILIVLKESDLQNVQNVDIVHFSIYHNRNMYVKHISNNF